MRISANTWRWKQAHWIHLRDAPGGRWPTRPIAAQLLYESRSEGAAWRRGTDFYSEGDLIWLEADVLIRQQTQGKRSLEDFCRAFYGAPNSVPRVVPYNREDVIAALNEVAPYDWNGFFQKRVYEINVRAPLGGIEGSGWKLGYTNAVPAFLKAREGAWKRTDVRQSLGFSLREDGYIIDVLPGSPADKAGLSSAMKLVAVNERRWSPELLRDAIKSAAGNRAPLDLLIENADYFKTCKVDYHGGEKYPTLVREPSKPDLLTEILKPLTPEPPP